MDTHLFKSQQFILILLKQIYNAQMTAVSLNKFDQNIGIIKDWLTITSYFVVIGGFVA